MRSVSTAISCGLLTLLALLSHVLAESKNFSFDAAAVQRRLTDDLTYLAADELEGRGPKTRGLELAADHIHAQFDAAGLKTDSYGGRPFQVFRSWDTTELSADNSLAVLLPDGKTQECKMHDEFRPLVLSGSRRFDVPLVFAGFGITAPEHEYDDYADVDVKGKAVIVLRHEPRQSDASSEIFNGTKNSAHAYLDEKVRNAVRHGAAMVVFCNDRNQMDQNIKRSVRSSGDPDRLMAFDVKTKLTERSIPVVHCRRSLIDSWLKSTGHDDLEQLEASINESLEPRTFALNGIRLRGAVSITQSKKALKNVVGVLPGKGDLAAETVVVGAHYDHLGFGGGGSLAPWTSEIHNGADDNASGTAALMEIARQIAAQAGGNHRRILFIAFSAEEMGLIGSAYYCRHPLFGLRETVAMVNLDMVGRLRNDTLTAYGMGTAEEFNKLVSDKASRNRLKLKKISSGFGPSDHASFHGHGIPVLHFFTGFHSEYHRPSDDSDRINFEGLQRITRATTEIVWQLATMPERPQPKRSGIVRSIPGSGPRSPARRVQLGVELDKTHAGKGFAVKRVLPNSAAEKAGIQPGDLITRYQSIEVDTSRDLIEAVKADKQGDKVQLRITRGAIELEVEVVLGSG